MPKVLLIEVLIPAIADPIVNGQVSVSVETVPAADAASVAIGGAEILLRNFTSTREVRLRVECPVAAGAAVGRLEASATLKRRRTGALRAGDFLTAVACPFGSDGTAVVRLDAFDG